VSGAVAAPRSPAARDAVDAAATLLRGRGERMTAPRRAVLSVLAEDARHLSADQVVSAVAVLDPAVHRASVYRALEALSQLGVVQHVHLGHGTTTYALAQDRPHLHGHCNRCGSVVDLPGDLLDDVAARLGAESGFVLDPAHVALSGTCGSCSAADRAAQTSVERD
jgi:Fur family ferric uptake transcriptional regulator